MIFELWYNETMTYPKGLPVGKRIFDLVLTLPGLVILSPLFLVTTLFILVRMGRPVLFRQTRPGYKGKLFVIYKFRSMTNDVDAEGDLLPDRKRISRLGKFLRSTSIDELPELFNILRGEMSLVGPRPLLVEYLDRYNEEQMHRHDVLPGMTGWAQINGRNLMDWTDKFRYDVWYVNNWSLWLDFKIMTLTVWKALKREGISQEGYATAPVFKGTDDGQSQIDLSIFDNTENSKSERQDKKTEN